MDLREALGFLTEIGDYRADMWKMVADGEPERLQDELNCFLESDTAEGRNMFLLVSTAVATVRSFVDKYPKLISAIDGISKL